ncbi:MAG: YkgJ family cysteine cluster protein [Candidatus Desulfofervidaceae bacterium]|nr:YkgJ family cysteine cluster protein [Candidatus Desulfofervidaceae bacterium]MDL1970922.1 YkgJ family cysteine cluster protein [Candidatus Desulfofervidaceae bacterium]
MDIQEKIEKLQEIYREFEEEVRELKNGAVCQRGCADCCKQMATIDLTTLEGFIIYEKISAFDDTIKVWAKKRLKKDIIKRKKTHYARCPFLKEDDTCLIYEVRPFSCRWLYSLKKCNGGSPVVHRQAFEIAKKTIRKIQQLDDTGYSGHISFILGLFDKIDFRKTYLSGDFQPRKLKKFMADYHITVNQYLK